ncbi:MAG: DNA topoisomerase IB [Actinomycetota bacterium]|nr:DNA topoisomerase IB [Actinomycetota bacterium]
MRLRQVTSSMPGWSRRRQGRGFTYVGADGRTLHGTDRERCEALVIPPAWTGVWICPLPQGHLQAVGTDDAGRRQYLYHPDWRIKRDAEKFLQMETFAAALPAARRRAHRHLDGSEPSQDFASALAFVMLDHGVFRIGSERYLDDNGSYGLTTIDKEHTLLNRSGIEISYPGKSSQEVEVEITDARACDAIRLLRSRRGGSDRLLAYKDGRLWRNLDADQANSYIKQLMGEPASAKDFRTWRGTVAAAAALAAADAHSKSARKSAVTEAICVAADHLGNTPAVAKSAYVDPRIVDLFEDGIVIDRPKRLVAPGACLSPTVERQVLHLLVSTH